MEMLRKIIDRKSLESFPKNVCDRVLRICSKNYITCPTTEVSLRGFCKIALYRVLRKRSVRYFCHTLSGKVAGLQSLGYNFTKKEAFDKNI